MEIIKMFPKWLQFDSRCLQRMFMLMQFIQDMSFSAHCEFSFHKCNVKKSR